MKKAQRTKEHIVVIFTDHDAGATPHHAAQICCPFAGGCQ